MFDIAAVARCNGADYLAMPLSRFPDRVATAVQVAERYQPLLFWPVLARLNVRPAFEDLRETARDETENILRRALYLAGR